MCAYNYLLMKNILLKEKIFYLIFNLYIETHYFINGNLFKVKIIT